MRDPCREAERRPRLRRGGWRSAIVVPLLSLLALGSGGAEAAGAASQDIFNNFNGGTVDNSPMAATVFTIKQSYLITMVLDYHWNNGEGSPGGTIALRCSQGVVHGPWNVVTSSGSGASNVNWTAEPSVVLPAGTYTVVDSDPATWSQDPQSGGAGFSEVKGVVATSSTTTSPTTSSPQPGGTWRVVSPKKLAPMLNVTCPSSTFCIAVGQDGTIMTSSNSGLTWAKRPSGTHYNLYGAACPTSKACIVVGALGAGIILTSANGGATWTTRWTASSTSVNAVTCTSNRDCIAVGYPGLILTTADGGATWTNRPNPLSPYPQSLSVVVCPTPSDCIAVGADIMTTANGGATWTERLNPLSGTRSGFAGIACRGTNSCLATGEQNVATANRGKTWAVPMKKYTYDGGKTWMTYPRIYGNTVKCLNARSVCLLLSTASSLWESGDGGVTWFMVWKALYALNSFACPSANACVAVGKPDAMSTTGLIVRRASGL